MIQKKRRGGEGIFMEEKRQNSINVDVCIYLFYVTDNVWWIKLYVNNYRLSLIAEREK